MRMHNKAYKDPYQCKSGTQFTTRVSSFNLSISTCGWYV